MRDDVYERIIFVINNTKGSKIIPDRECFKILKENFPDVSDYTIGSIYSLEYMRKMKQNHYKISKFAKDLHIRFNAAVAEGQPEGILLRMSDEIDLSPALLARLIVEQWYHNEVKENGEASSTKIPESNLAEGPAMIEEETVYNSKLVVAKVSHPNIPASNFPKKEPVSILKKDPPTKDLVTETMAIATLSEAIENALNLVENSIATTSQQVDEEGEEEESAVNEDPLPRMTITSLMKNPALIYDPHLAMETFLCTLHDDQYGPIADCIKHSLGQEYEMRLVRLARAAGLIFRSEGDLRTTGFDKTPDIKLDVPAVIDGFIINWIESKALFGDEETHKGYVKDQYQCYWNRFGTGMVIYWFGYLDKLVSRNQDQFMIADDFPKCISQMDLEPTMPKCPQFY